MASRKNLTTELYVSGALAEGATGPDPGGSAAHGVRAYSTSLGRLMEWRGTFWASVPDITVGTTAPTSPRAGDLWVDTN